MKLHYKGKYNLDPESLPHGEHQPGAVQFKEANDSKQMSIIMNVIAFIIIIPLFVILYLRCGKAIVEHMMVGALLSLLCLFPHEILHAICFKEDVYLYTNLKQGMLFVIGPELMSKGRFIFMSLLPNLVFGFIPFIVALCVPSLALLGVLGVINIVSGSGDYYNVFNALTQMPKGARTYLYQFHSYWYMPEEQGE